MMVERFEKRYIEKLNAIVFAYKRNFIDKEQVFFEMNALLYKFKKIISDLYNCGILNTKEYTTLKKSIVELHLNHTDRFSISEMTKCYWAWA